VEDDKSMISFSGEGREKKRGLPNSQGAAVDHTISEGGLGSQQGQKREKGEAGLNPSGKEGKEKGN